MNVLHLSTFGAVGGAAIAARRLHDGLRLLGHDSAFLSRDGAGPGDVTPDGARVLTPAPIESSVYPIYQRLRGAGVDTLFSSDLPTRLLSETPALRDADVVHLHWVAGFVTAPAIRMIQELGKPVVWTLHDQAPFTGGCHYAGGCTAYRSGCNACPQLDAAAAHVPAAFLAHKRHWLRTPLEIVCPSDWLAACARSSALLHDANVRTIPNGLPVATYQGLTQEDARAQLGLPADALILLIGSDHLDERRKGHAHALTAMAQMAASPALGERLRRGDVVCVAYGEGDLAAGGIPVLRLGRLDGDAQIARAYRAADVFLLPSLDDNLPNTLLEATAAGTPIVAYSTGGIPDIVERAGCGLLVPRGDAAALGAALTFLADDPAARRRMGLNGATYAGRHLDLPSVASAYLEVYGELLEHTAAAARLAVTAHRPVATPEAVRASEELLVTSIVSTPALAGRLIDELARDGAAHQRLIAERGGEIDYLRREIARIEDGWRESRETLHQATQDLTAAASALAVERQGHDITRATLGAELAALSRKLRHQMTDVVILGTGDTGRRLWEALTRCGAHVVAFVEPADRSTPRSLLGLGVHGLDWLARGAWDVVVVPDEPADASLDLIAGGVDPSRIAVVPTGTSDNDLMATVAARFPDPIAPWLAGRVRSQAVRVGIFGTGSAAMKVWEALAEIDEAEPVWFADNNPARQGGTYLWLDVIAPSEIAGRGFDAVVVGSMSRDVIRQQLAALGIDTNAVLTPDVSGPPDTIRPALIEWLQRRQSQEVVR